MLRTHIAIITLGLLAAACGGGGGGGSVASSVKSWSAPERISFANGNVGDPQIAADAGGNAVAIFRDSDGAAGGGWGATVNRLMPGGWEQPTRISNVSSDSGTARDSDIAVGATGELVAVWTQKPPGLSNNDAWSNYRDPATGWSAPRLQESRTQAAFGVRIAMDTNGSGTAVWAEDATNPGSDDNVWVSNYTPGGNWGTPIRIDNWTSGNITTNISGPPAIAADGNGRVYVAWSQGVGSGTSLFTSFSAGPTSATWTTELVDTLSPPALRADIAANASGTTFLIWQQTEVAGNALKIWARRRPNDNLAGAWEPPVRLDSNTGADADNPRIAVDAGGNAIAVWQQSDGARSDIWTNRYISGSGWGTARKLEIEDGNAADPRLAIGTNGEAFAVWRQNDSNGDPRVWSAIFRPGSGWNSPVRLENNSGKRALSPAVAVDGSGNAVVVWRLSDPAVSGVSKTWASQYR
jgi:hypothetical protein